MAPSKNEATVKDLLNQLSMCIHNSSKSSDTYETTIFSAYALLKAKQESPTAKPSFADMLGMINKNELIRYSVENTVADLWETFEDIYTICDIDALRRDIITPTLSKTPYHVSTPSSISDLAINLLNITDTDTVADFGTGDGEFIVNAYNSNTGAEYLGIEINTTLAAIAAIRAEVLGQNTKVEQHNMFFLWNEQRRFTKVFSDYPFGQKNLREGLEFAAARFGNTVLIPQNSSSDWLYNLLLSECITDDGKAIGIMTQGACFNGIDKTLRQYFVENGLIEAVITLPAKMYIETAIPVVLIVISKGNQNIRLVDATNIYKRGRRQNEFEAEHIQTIIEALHTDSAISRTVTANELAIDNYNISPKKLLNKPAEIKNGIAFGNVIKKIIRGVQLPADEIDEMIVKEPTDYQYMMLRDIQDGVINENLPYLRSLEPRLEKYCAAPGNLLLSKSGAPFKVAVVDTSIKKMMLATGNLFIIELDESRIRPLYLKAFLESEMGICALENAAVGTTLPVIQLEALKSLIIPCPPIEEQQKIEDSYVFNQNKIKLLKSQLSAAIEASKSFFKEAE